MDHILGILVDGKVFYVPGLKGNPMLGFLAACEYLSTYGDDDVKDEFANIEEILAEHVEGADAAVNMIGSVVQRSV